MIHYLLVASYILHDEEKARFYERLFQHSGASAPRGDGDTR